MPAQAGIQGFTATGLSSLWIPAFAGMTIWRGATRLTYSHSRESGLCFTSAERNIQGFIAKGL
ncbi:hypothetical protein D9T17_01635 [Lysobacter enzymogenes]|uniref:Uncharacterized protein n=1 Tax=Lysobacter enzymogenes TaxID=69 RepID=A0A3N2RNV6_LYSEN|nr:hypothetical protein D9T17_01635 [Lysobacter enzymogenes]